MNKNPFVPTPSYTAPQPPLPPGPPPPQPAQPDYSGWWASAAAQQPHVQQPGAAQYTPQWTPPQPARPAHDQSALYANYGYGNQPGNWQRQQQQQYQPQQHYATPAAPQPPQAQPGYNPYQPTAGYPQPYVPQPAVAPPPQPMGQAVYPPQTPQQPFFNPHLPQGQPQQPRMHHGSQHQPPAKRQRFDGPNANRQNAPPPPPQFQAPPPPPGGGSFTGPTGSRNAPPSGPSQMGSGGRVGGPGGRAGAQGGRGRGGSFTANRGGGANRGRGTGSTFLGGAGNANRGGGPGGQQGSLRGHGSRNNFGGPNTRRGGGSSFNAGGYHRGSSFRNRDHSTANRTGPRHDGSGGAGGTSCNKDAALSPSFSNVGKKDESRRTLTDFKIVGLSIPELDWSWGDVPTAVPSPPTVEVKQEVTDSEGSLVVKQENADDKSSLQADATGEGNDGSTTEIKPDISAQTATSEETPASDIKSSPETQGQAASSRYPSDLNGANPPPSRLRIYFHTPVTADDSRPIPHNPSPLFEESRKGKRKKLDDDDGDLEEGRAPPPPPQMSGLNDDRSSIAASVAPSVAETASEGDWLMAAIVEGEEDAEGVVDTAHEEVGADGAGQGGEVKADAHHEELDDLDAEGEVETLMDGDNLDDDVDMAGGEMLTTEASAPETQSLNAPAVSNGAPAPENDAPAPDIPSEPVASSDGPVNDSPGAVVDDKQQELDPSQLSAMAELPAPSEPQSQAPAPVESANDVANNPDSVDTQVQDTPLPVNGTTKTLEAASADPTLLIVETQETTQIDTDAQTTANVDQTLKDAPQSQGQGQEDAPQPQEPVPDAPKSPSPKHPEDIDAAPPTKQEPSGPASPSANRLAVSYAGGNRRFVINAEIVSSFQLFRQEGRIEVNLDLSKDSGYDGLKGLLVETLSEESKTYVTIPGVLDSATESDDSVPPFFKLPLPASIQLLVHLDTSRPLSDPKWAKTGDVQEWLKSMFGRMFWVAGDAAEGWEKKIHVVDPDPPPTIWTFLDGWATHSPVGAVTERQRFLKTHMTETDNILEILLRLVRGERATPFSHNTPQISVPSLSGPLLSALTPGSAHGAQQTHVSLAVLAIFRLTVEYAKKALGDEKGKTEAEEKVGDIIRCLPSHLIYKSLDGMFKEWKMEKKGGR
ncbi:proteasome subunit alpha type 1 [Coprinopsis cinerea AmutBmut pab1-1]|nr:proteasome subunit alpha type 1 [Coprinopsis cinerea AmutBmut pab1-1]